MQQVREISQADHRRFSFVACDNGAGSVPLLACIGLTNGDYINPGLLGLEKKQVTPAIKHWLDFTNRPGIQIEHGTGDMNA